MKCDLCGGRLKNKKISYAIEFKGFLHIIEHAPVKECLQCGERLFSPRTVERIQNVIWQERKPDRIIEMPVIDYAYIN